MVVDIAVIDPRSKAPLTNPQIGTLVTRLDGFSDGMGNPGQLAATWQVRLDAITDLPRAAIQNIRVYERCFYLSQ